MGGRFTFTEQQLPQAALEQGTADDHRASEDQHPGSQRDLPAVSGRVYGHPHSGDSPPAHAWPSAPLHTDPPRFTPSGLAPYRHAVRSRTCGRRQTAARSSSEVEKRPSVADDHRWWSTSTIAPGSDDAHTPPTTGKERPVGSGDGALAGAPRCRGQRVAGAGGVRRENGHLPRLPGRGAGLVARAQPRRRPFGVREVRPPRAVPRRPERRRALPGPCCRPHRGDPDRAAHGARGEVTDGWRGDPAVCASRCGRDAVRGAVGRSRGDRYMVRGPDATAARAFKAPASRRPGRPAGRPASPPFPPGAGPCRSARKRSRLRRLLRAVRHGDDRLVSLAVPLRRRLHRRDQQRVRPAEPDRELGVGRDGRGLAADPDVRRAAGRGRLRGHLRDDRSRAGERRGSRGSR